MGRNMNFNGAVAIVTGSATGVGAACVLRLAESGARVVVNYAHSATEAEQTAQACRALGAEVALIRADIAEDAACRAMVAEAVARWGRLDLLINNAAMTVKSDPFDLETLDAQDFRAVFDVNVIGLYQMCRAALPHLRASGDGAIVNVSSNVAFTGGGSSLAYTASKGAVNALTLALARVAAPQVRVNAVCPGVIDTRWMRRALGEQDYAGFAAANAEITPLGRLASAQDVAEAVLWLAGGAGFVTGELLSVDGGIRLMGKRNRSAEAR